MSRLQLSHSVWLNPIRESPTRADEWRLCWVIKPVATCREMFTLLSSVPRWEQPEGTGEFSGSCGKDSVLLHMKRQEGRKADVASKKVLPTTIQI